MEYLIANKHWCMSVLGLLRMLVQQIMWPHICDEYK